MRAKNIRSPNFLNESLVGPILGKKGQMFFAIFETFLLLDISGITLK